MMGTKTFNNYEDLLTFTRASKGHALRPVSYGSEEVTNGTFDSDTSNWTAYGGSSLSVVSGELNVTNDSSGYGYASQAVTTEVGKVYRLTFDFNHLGTTGHYRLGTALGTDDITSSNLSSDQSVEHFFVATTTTVYIRVGNQANTAGHDVQYDNISVKEVTFDESDGTLTLFEHPNNIPRVEYDADGNRLGLLVEEARTNLVTYSEDFSQWTGVSDPNEILAPDGTLTATKARDNNQGTNAAVTLIEPVTVSTSTTYTYSVFGKKGQLNWMALGVIQFTTPNNGRVWFDLDSGVVGTQGSGLSGAIEEFPNGWYRCSVTFTTDAVDTTGQLYIYLCEGDNLFLNTNRDGTSDLYVWGAQLEAGSFPTSYIKTTGSTATRSADVASIPVADFGYNHTAGTVVVDYESTFEDGGASYPRAFEITAGTSATDRILVFASEPNDNAQASVFVNGTGQTGMTFETSLDGKINTKVAFGFAKNNFAVSDDGDSVVTDTSGNVEPSSKRTKLTFGGTGTGLSGQLNGHIKSFKYYPRRLTNAQLEDLSS